MFQINVVEKIKTYFMFNRFVLNSAIYKTMWKYMVQTDRQTVTKHGAIKMRFECRMINDKIKTHS